MGQHQAECRLSVQLFRNRECCYHTGIRSYIVFTACMKLPGFLQLLILHTLPPVTAFLSILLHDMVIFPLTIVLLFSACHTPSLHESIYYKRHSVFIIGSGNIICDLFYLRLCVCHCHTKPGKCNHRLVIKAISTADHLLLLFSQIF